MNPFGKFFKIALALIAAVYALSVAGFNEPLIATISFCIIVGGVLALSFIDLRYGVYAVLGELFVGGHGHLFDLFLGNFVLSVRMGIFLAVLIAWCFKLGQEAFSGRSFWKSELLCFFRKNDFSLWYALLFAGAGIGVAEGFIFKNSKALLFADINGWFFYALVVLFFAVSEKLKRRQSLEIILQLLSAALVWHFISAVVLEMIFSHKDDFWLIYKPFTGLVYKWLRDLRLFEIGVFQSRFYRIFSPSYLTSVVGFFVFLWVGLRVLIQKGDIKSAFQDKTIRANWLLVSLASTTLMISLSRAFWAGIAFALICSIFYAFMVVRIQWNQCALFCAGLCGSLVFSLTVILIALNIPISTMLQFTYPSDILSERLILTTDDPGIGSRWALLPVLNTAILKRPLFGYGFGKTVRYQSKDPRIVNISQGDYTTYVFEWGYHDFAVKMGLVGLAAYLALIFALVLSAHRMLAENKEKSFEHFFLFGIMFGFIGISAVHFFSPYLNHPLGIGYVLLASALFFKTRT